MDEKQRKNDLLKLRTLKITNIICHIMITVGGKLQNKAQTPS